MASPRQQGRVGLGGAGKAIELTADDARGQFHQGLQRGPRGEHQRRPFAPLSPRRARRVSKAPALVRAL